MGRKSGYLRKFLKLSVVVVCTVGFLLQTLEFMNLYWTYPTVVDIQVSIPSEIELPGISICNANGIYPEAVCNMKGACTQPAMFKFLDLCSVYPVLCKDGQIPPGFRGITYNKFMSEHQLNASALGLLRLPLKRYLKCKIVSDSSERDCQIDDAIYGSYYSEAFMPNFCYSINTVWSQPDKKIEKIKKSEKIQMEFYTDIVNRETNPPIDKKLYPRYNYPSNIAIQLAVHSPYINPSPYKYGQAFLGGKKYEIKLKQDEKHLLPPPYQTNCTDYMPAYKSRGNIGPLNQIMIIQECKLNASLEKQGCIPLSVDFPHNLDICKICDNCNDTIGIWDHCTDLLDAYNQPCDFISYDMDVEEKAVYVEKPFKSSFVRVDEKAVFREMGYNCTDDKILTRRCQTVKVDIVFDNFEISNLTYNPKYESLEIFSVVGGYMGMYLGISIVTVYDFAELIATSFYHYCQKKRKAKRKKKKLLNGNAYPKRIMDPFERNLEFRKRNTVYSYRDGY